MKKALLTLILSTILTTVAFASSEQEAEDFFNKYINAANTYNPSIVDMYSPNAKIIRQVVKPDNTTQNVYTDTATYIKQMKLGQVGAKLRHYTNNYTNIAVTTVDKNTYKVSSLRQPSGETYKLKAYMIVQEQPNGNWLIIEEMMQTKEQILLKYAKQ